MIDPDVMRRFAQEYSNRSIADSLPPQQLVYRTGTVAGVSGATASVTFADGKTIASIPFYNGLALAINNIVDVLFVDSVPRIVGRY